MFHSDNELPEKEINKVTPGKLATETKPINTFIKQMEDLYKGHCKILLKKLKMKHTLEKLMFMDLKDQYHWLCLSIPPKGIYFSKFHILYLLFTSQ